MLYWLVSHHPPASRRHGSRSDRSIGNPVEGPPRGTQRYSTAILFTRTESPTNSSRNRYERVRPPRSSRKPKTALSGRRPRSVILWGPLVAGGGVVTPSFKSATLLRFPARRVFQNPLRACRIENPAGAEPRHVTRRLFRGPAALFHPVDHLLCERMAYHPVPAHGRQQQHLRIRQQFGLALESQRIADAMPRNSGRVTALLGPIHRSRNIHADPEVRFAHRRDEILRRHLIIEHRRHRARSIQPVDHRLKIRRQIPIPVRRRIH